MEEKIIIGHISAVQGLRGEVRLFHDSGDEEALGRLTTLFLRNGEAETAYRIEVQRMQRRTPILKLQGVEDRVSAEALIGADVYALLREATPDEPDAWLVSDLVGLEVFLEEAEEAALGRVMGVIDNPAHDLLEIDTGSARLMLPFIDTFVREVDTAGRRMVIVPPDGWAD